MKRQKQIQGEMHKGHAKVTTDNRTYQGMAVYLLHFWVSHVIHTHCYHCTVRVIKLVFSYQILDKPTCLGQFAKGQAEKNDGLRCSEEAQQGTAIMSDATA